jgi:hypothetical protein
VADSRKPTLVAEWYRLFLAEAGYYPRIDANGDVLFSWEGRTYVIKIDEEDPQYFSLAHAAFWPIESDEDLSQARKAACAVTAEIKVVKIFLKDTRAWAAIELFCFPPLMTKDVLRRCLKALHAAEKQLTP